MQNSPNKFLFQFIGNFNGVLLINELTRNEKKTKKKLSLLVLCVGETVSFVGR